MSFISLEFAVFFSTFFFVYWILLGDSRKKQNLLILISSYIFYGWWDYRLLSLILISSGVDFVVGQKIHETEDLKKRKYLLWLSLFTNLGILFSFKYFNFFIESFNDLFGLVGSDFHWNTIYIILPVGISFYTLQTLSYTIDIYDRKLSPNKSIVEFFSFVSFFPQLVAGPIETARNLLPQFSKPRELNYDQVADGFRQILWGLFKKMVIADNILVYTSVIIKDLDSYNSSTIFFVATFEVIRMYCDFSGYSDIALGTARTLGFDLKKNFDYPLFSRNMSEFWNKWHISLITWLKTYILFKLPRGKKARFAFNIIIIFLISGLWHGANWTFVIWGTLHGIILSLTMFTNRKKYRTYIAEGRILPTFSEAFAVFKTFYIFGIVGIFFIAPTIGQGFWAFVNMFNPMNYGIPQIPNIYVILATVFLLIVEWFQRGNDHGLYFGNIQISPFTRWAIYISLVLVIISFGGDTADFLYFQF